MRVYSSSPSGKGGGSGNENTLYQEVVEKLLYDNPRAAPVRGDASAPVSKAVYSDLDYLGQVDFCLRASDSALSAPSRSAQPPVLAP